MPHSPRTVIFPSPPSPTSPLPSLVHLLYSPTSSVILHLNPTSSQRLSVTELANASLPPINGRQVDAPQPAVGGSGDSVGGSGLGMGMGAFSGLGGYVGLGSKAAVPVGTRTVGGEVVIAREGQFSHRICNTPADSRRRSILLGGRQLHKRRIYTMGQSTRSAR